jgi:CHASE1-domain containing sensor protein
LPVKQQIVRLVEHHPERETITAWQRTMLRRLGALLCTGTLAFTLTTWILVQRVERAPAAMAGLQETPADTAEERSAEASEPAKAARAHLDALNRGDIRAAYEMFSPHYRQTASFDAFKALVRAHRSMFRTEEEELDSTSITSDRVRIDVHVQSEDDEHYIAHYTMARLNGRWFVDELRWVRADDEDEELTST